jgi:hypothetical protein
MRVVIAVILPIAVLVGVGVGFRIAVNALERGPVMRALRTKATNLQGRAAQVRSTAPATTGPGAERALAVSLAEQPEVAVLGTSTGSDGRLRVDVSLWADARAGEDSLDSPGVAEACVRVLVTVGTVQGRIRSSRQRRGRAIPVPGEGATGWVSRQLITTVGSPA